MKRLHKIVLAFFFLAPFAQNSNATDVEFRGSVGYQINGNQVELRMETLYNASPNITSGTLHIRMFATPSPEINQLGYIMADANLGQFTTNNGQLAPGFGYSNLEITVPFNRPPDGRWYIHFYVSEFPNLSTILDYRTFSNTLTWGDPIDPPPPTNPGPGADDGDRFQTATAIGPNTSRNAAIEAAGDVDMFRVQVSSEGTLSVGTTGNTDTVGTIYDEGGSPIASNDDVGGDLNFGVDTRVAAGTYFIKVEGYDDFATGAYTLNVNFEADDTGFRNINVNSGGGAATPLMLILLAMVGVARRLRSA